MTASGSTTPEVRTDRTRLVGLVAAAAGVLAISVAVVVIGMGIAFWSGWAGSPGAWLTVSAALAAPGAALFWLVFGIWRRRVAIGGMVAVVAVAVLGATVVVRASPPSPGRLASTLDEIDLPDDLEQRSERREGGVCFTNCPAVTRLYTAPRPAADVLADVVAAFDRAGYDMARHAGSAYGGVGPHHVLIQAHDTAPAGSSEPRAQVEVMLQGNTS